MTVLTAAIQDVEAQQPSAQVASAPGSDETSAVATDANGPPSTQNQQYAYSGRGGAGNWYSPSDLSQQGKFSSTQHAATTSGSAVDLPSARTGRGGAGNFVWGAEKEREEQLAREREEEEKLKTQAALDVEKGLTKPESAFLRVANPQSKS